MRFVVPSVDLTSYRPSHSATRLLTKQLCEQHGIVPVSIARGALIVAMAQPERAEALRPELEIFTGMKIEVVRASAEEIASTIKACYGDVS